MFHDTKGLKPKKYFRVLSCFIYTIIDNYVYIDYLDCQSKQLSQISVYSKYVGKYFNTILCIEIPYLLMNLFLCHGILKNIKSIVILKCPKRMLEYYFSKGFGILEYNFNNLVKLQNEVKQIIHAEETHNSDYVMTCIYTIPPISNTLKKLLLHKSLHSYYIQTKYNDKE